VILAIRTDQPRAELYLLDVKGKECARHAWQADRQLAATLLGEITQLLTRQNIAPSDLNGIVVFSGSGSFTGLRIGTTVANALAYSLSIPVVKTAGADWLSGVGSALAKAQLGQFVQPDYDRAPNIT